MVLSDRKMKVCEIVEILKISNGSGFTILHEQLCMKKVPRFAHLTKKYNVSGTLSAVWSCFATLKRNYCVGMSQWTKQGSIILLLSTIVGLLNGSKLVRVNLSDLKRRSWLVSLFGVSCGIIFLDYLPKGKTINSKYYIALSNRLRREIVAKLPHMARKKVIFHQDNAPSHNSMRAMPNLHELRFELLPHPSFIRNLAP
uniref:Histonelysine Nmethyltransferase SETMARlike [Hydra vulgaris] n=1 Tax=Lepeophtheirus salmonis TaxID=72036 RepID=A0A0K2TRE8_LEPSM